jgi:hypothetical protein
MSMEWVLLLGVGAFGAGAWLGVRVERRQWVSAAHEDYLVAGARYCHGTFFYVLPERTFNFVQMKALAWEQSNAASAKRGQ